MDLKDCSTKQLVEELSCREGVERIEIDPSETTVKIAVCKDGKYPYDQIKDGPAIIFYIID